jgi:hypothetical protein
MMGAQNNTANATYSSFSGAAFSSTIRINLAPRDLFAFAASLAAAAAVSFWAFLKRGRMGIEKKKKKKKKNEKNNKESICLHVNFHL